MTLENLELFIRNEDDFTKAFKHKLTSPEKLGVDLWAWNPTRECYSITTLNGSILELKFFDTVKPIFDYRNVEIPGKESFLCYINVTVRPASIKGYTFRSDLRQSVWGDSKSAAVKKHEQGLHIIRGKAKSLGIEVTDDQWRHNFDRTNY